MRFNCEDLIRLFNQLFQTAEETILVSGGTEPLYLPKSAEFPLHRIIFTKDYFASALHEIAHWCIAGKARRQLVDYGYWYNPDGRNAKEQQLFEQVEVNPQAIECMFSLAAGFPFQFSADNVLNNNFVSDVFKDNIQRQVSHYLNHGLPQRAHLFQQALRSFYQKASLSDGFNDINTACLDLAA